MEGKLTGHKKRMPAKTQYLIEQVLNRIVPEFEKRGFVWYPDFAENNPQEIGANEIPLQKRQGDEWPTVQIFFVPSAPSFQIYFSALPEECYSPISKVPRNIAIVVYTPLYFVLCNTLKYHNFGFGLSIGRILRYYVNWRKFLDSEVDAAIDLLPLLFEIFDNKIYQKWENHPFGYVDKHVFLPKSSRIRCDLARRN